MAPINSRLHRSLLKYHWILVLFLIVTVLSMIYVSHPYIDRHDVDTGFGFKHPILWCYQKYERAWTYGVTASSWLDQDDQVYIHLSMEGKAGLVGLVDVPIDINLAIQSQSDTWQTSKPDWEIIEPATIVPDSQGTVATVLFQNSDSQEIRLTVVYLGRGLYGVAETYYGSDDKLNQEADAVVSSMYYSAYPTSLH